MVFIIEKYAHKVYSSFLYYFLQLFPKSKCFQNKKLQNVEICYNKIAITIG